MRQPSVAQAKTSPATTVAATVSMRHQTTLFCQSRSSLSAMLNSSSQRSLSPWPGVVKAN